MLQIQLFRNQRDHVIERLGVKHFSDIAIVDKIILLDEERRKLQAENDANLAKINAASKEIGKLMANGKI